VWVGCKIRSKYADYKIGTTTKLWENWEIEEKSHLVGFGDSIHPSAAG
jgi:hypothetical protein